jgi:hypothetical protein
MEARADDAVHIQAERIEVLATRRVRVRQGKVAETGYFGLNAAGNDLRAAPLEPNEERRHTHAVTIMY